MAINSVKWISRIGQGLGYLSLGYSGIKLYTHPNLSNGIDFGVSAVSVAFGEIGAVYYIGKLSFEANMYMYNQNIAHGIEPSFTHLLIGKE